MNDPNEYWTSWNYSKSNVRLCDSRDMMISILGYCTGCCDLTSADGILYLITTVCFINWNGYWRLTLFITSEPSYVIANSMSSPSRYINFKIIVLEFVSLLGIEQEL